MKTYHSKYWKALWNCVEIGLKKEGLSWTWKRNRIVLCRQLSTVLGQQIDHGLKSLEHSLFCIVQIDEYCLNA